MDTPALTMDYVASGRVMPVANLPTTSKKLYDCISGPNFTLNTEDFPEFYQAIEYSLATPGLWCHETIKKKANEFNKDKPDEAETYLRITLGQNNGESPGIPYVMEIWPAGHYSPVHSHAGAEAVIRVLEGDINVSLFPFLSASVKPFTKGNFIKDDVMWISPTLNQTHQLKNLGDKTCVTIQCYMYDGNDNRHYDYFDYLDNQGVVQQYTPDVDMDFLQFKELMLEEWVTRPLPWWNSC
jgi:predicted metal-dependent enzyme (double-stranded beta helix superfamily)